jgi:hypothetical protein
VRLVADLRQSGTGSDCERKTIAVMTVDFVIIRFLPRCEIEREWSFTIVVLDGRQASSTIRIKRNGNPHWLLDFSCMCAADADDLPC